jgi:hypothetical protein
MDPLWWFPERGDATDRARKVCADCPDQLACADWALAAPTRLVGIWGGLSGFDRQRIRRGTRARVHDGAMSDVGIAGTNGHVDLAEPEARHTQPFSVASSEPRICAAPNCGNQLVGKQERFCSRRCQKKDSYARSGRPARTPAVKQPSSTTAIRIDPTAVLASAGFELTGYMLTDSGGQPWLLTRSQTGGNHP